MMSRPDFVRAFIEAHDGRMPVKLRLPDQYPPQCEIGLCDRDAAYRLGEYVVCEEHTKEIERRISH